MIIKANNWASLIQKLLAAGYDMCDLASPFSRDRQGEWSCAIKPSSVK